MSAQVRDTDGKFLGHDPRECGEHRTVGDHRAWCYDCVEWCYPFAPCVRCELPAFRALLTLPMPDAVAQLLAMRAAEARL